MQKQILLLLITVGIVVHVQAQKIIPNHIWKQQSAVLNCVGVHPIENDSFQKYEIYNVVDQAEFEKRKYEMRYNIKVKRNIAWHPNGILSIRTDSVFRDFVTQVYISEENKVDLSASIQREFMRFKMHQKSDSSIDSFYVPPTYRQWYAGHKHYLKYRYYNALLDQNIFIGTLSLSYMPGWANRTIRVFAPQFTEQTSLQQRYDQERAMYGHAITGSAGLHLSRRSVLSLSYMHVKQGFQSNKLSVNWSTGLPNSSWNDEQYRFANHAIGLNYTLSGYRHVVNGVLDFGAYYGWRDYYHINGPDRQSDGLRQEHFILRGGLGLNIRPDYRWEFRVVPTVLLNVNSINRGSRLRTNLVNLGVDVGVVYHFAKMFNKKAVCSESVKGKGEQNENPVGQISTEAGASTDSAAESPVPDTLPGSPTPAPVRR